jgi:plasmid replication initiation protein
LKDFIQKQTEENDGRSPVAGKPNILIESRQGFKDIHEYRLFLAMLYMAYDGVDITKPFELDISYIIAGRGGSNYECLKEACTNVMSRVVDLLPNESKRFKLRHLVDKADYGELAGTGRLKVSFHPDVVPYILSMFKEGKYTKVFLKHALPIRSLYSVRIYELLLQHKDFGSRDIPLEEFRFFLDIPENKFKQWINIKQRILIPAQKHLEQYTDIKFEFFPNQKGRKVVGIHFIISPNLPNFNPASEQLDLFVDEPKKAIEQIQEHEKIVREHIWEESQSEILEKYSPERIVFYYNYCRKLEASGKKIADFSSFFFTALSEDRENFEEKALKRAKQIELRKQDELKKQSEESNQELEFIKAEKYFEMLPTEFQDLYINNVHSIIPQNIKKQTAIAAFCNEMADTFNDSPNLEDFVSRVIQKRATPNGK